MKRHRISHRAALTFAVGLSILTVLTPTCGAFGSVNASNKQHKVVTSEKIKVGVRRSTESFYEKAKRIVYTVFPASTAAAALRVVGCETGYTYTPYERGGYPYFAYGYFQFIIQNHNRTISYEGRTLKINWYRMYQPWYATRAAYILSSGGTNWSEWSCQP